MWKIQTPQKHVEYIYKSIIAIVYRTLSQNVWQDTIAEGGRVHLVMHSTYTFLTISKCLWLTLCLIISINILHWFVLCGFNAIGWSFAWQLLMRHISYIYIYTNRQYNAIYIYILILISMLMHVLLLMSFARINCCSFTGIGEQHNFLERKKMLRMQVPVPSWVSVGFGRKKNLGSTSDLRSFYQ